MTELNMILVVAIGLFILYLVNCGYNLNAFKSKLKSAFAGDLTNASQPADQSPQSPVSANTTTSAVDVKEQKNNTEDTYQGILLNSVVDNINGTGIISSNNVNTGLLLGDDDDADVNKYKVGYRNIVESEIGQDNINSQKQYSKYIKNDSSMRYLDTDLSANYGNFYGLSLTRSSNRGTKISATDSTQISNLSEQEFDANSANLRDFFA